MKIVVNLVTWINYNAEKFWTTVTIVSILVVCVETLLNDTIYSGLFLAACMVAIGSAQDFVNKRKGDIEPDRYPMCKDQPAQIDCRVIECKKHGKGACHDISPAITLNPDKSYACWSMEVDAPLPIKGE